jgi:hypothetical protein
MTPSQSKTASLAAASLLSRAPCNSASAWLFRSRTITTQKQTSRHDRESVVTARQVTQQDYSVDLYSKRLGVPDGLPEITFAVELLMSHVLMDDDDADVFVDL